MLHLVDGTAYTSERDRTKPHPMAFHAAMTADGATDPARRVFTGDRPYDDVFGAKNADLRAELMSGSGVPSYAAVEPDAIIARLADLRPLLESWSAA